MKPVIRIDKNGFYDFNDFVYLEDYEDVPTGFTAILPYHQDGSSMYKPRLINGHAVETATPEEMNPVLPLKEPSEMEKLQAQLKASNDYLDFLEEALVEMAQVVYQ